MADAKPDFRKDMNAILEVFYKSEGTVNVIREIQKFRIPYSDTIWMICDSLERDGYVKLFHGHSQSPVGSITGQGKIFFEQGGYRDTTSRLDKMIDWFKDHRLFSIIIFIGILITSLWGVVSIAKDVIEWINPTLP